jgi:hypothetical protein
MDLEEATLREQPLLVLRPAAPDSTFDLLTPREREVASLIAASRSAVAGRNDPATDARVDHEPCQACPSTAKNRRACDQACMLQLELNDT